MMQRLQMKPTALVAAFVAIGVVVVLLETVVAASDAALLFTLVFWIAVAEGCIALIAGADLSRAKWHLPLKQQLLSVYPLIPFLAILFLFLGLKLDIYPWAAKQDAWLNKSFFVVRNFVLLALVSLAGWKFARDSQRNSPNRNRSAVIYILCFVISQSLVAFDWVMTLEHPWINTLFGGYFFVESFYVGIALAGIISVWLLRSATNEDAPVLRKSLKDAATLMFGFALFWAGLFFSQYLVIWYGNIPEETGFLIRRISVSPWNTLSLLVLLSLFVGPFLLLLPRRAKTSPVMMVLMSAVVMGGVFLERIIFLVPVVPLNALLVILESVGLGFLLVAVIANSAWLLPQPETQRS